MIYVICSSPRTGSSLLSMALEKMGLGIPDEYFNPVKDDGDHLVQRHDFVQLPITSYIHKIKQERRRNGVFALKTHFHQLPEEVVERFGEFFPEAKCISVTRRNALRQAISFLRARQTQAWTKDLPARATPMFDYQTLCNFVVEFAKESERWEGFFIRHEITPFRVIYEELEADYFGVMKQVLDFLNWSGEIPPPPLAKQADALTEDWVSMALSAAAPNAL